MLFQTHQSTLCREHSSSHRISRSAARLTTRHRSASSSNPSPLRRRQEEAAIAARAVLKRQAEAECFAGVVTLDNESDPRFTILRGVCVGARSGRAVCGAKLHNRRKPEARVLELAIRCHAKGAFPEPPQLRITTWHPPHRPPAHPRRKRNRKRQAVEADDFAGLVRVLAWTLTGLDLMIANALIRTDGGVASDLFFVTGAAPAARI